MMMPEFTFAGLPPANDPEPWGRAMSLSVFGHGALVAFFLINNIGQTPVQKITLTEVNVVERKAVPKAPEASFGPGGGTSSGSTGRLGSPGKAEPVASHAHMGNIVPFSSPSGTAAGEVVMSGPIAGPIVPAGQIGMIGARKGSLAPLAGQTVGRKASGVLSMPTGNSTGVGNAIALSTEDIGDLRKRETSLGVPLISGQVARGSGAGGLGGGTGRIKALADDALGVNRKAGSQNLKSNPLDKERWGKQKGPFSMEGPLKYRKILKMELPPYPRWAEEKGVEASVSFRLWVNPKGRVNDNLYLENASGYAELDELAKEALKKFIFVTIPPELAQEDEWGVATFRFELKK